MGFNIDDALKNLNINIDAESVGIEISRGEETPIHVCYWHIEEVEEDANVAISIANAINLYHTNPRHLLELMNVENLHLL